MSQFDIRKPRGHREHLVCIRPLARARADFDMWREIIRPGQGRAVVRVRVLRRTPFKPMLRWLRDAAALEPAPETVESAGRDRDRGVRHAVLIELRDAAVVSVILQQDLHRAFALKRVVAAAHIGYWDVSCDPFVPA